MSGALTNTANITADSYYNSNNSAAALRSMAIGGTANTIASGADYSVIGGGYQNTIASGASHSAIGGGWLNGIGASSESSVIGGGDDNDIGTNSLYATIGGGEDLDIGNNASWSMIGGGRNNNVADNSACATITGGNYIDIGIGSSYATVDGGYLNVIGTNAWYAMIAGGAQNAVGNNAQYAFAAGRRAKANHPGAFVWADSGTTDFTSTYDNQFAVRASGGVYIQSSRGVALDTSTGPLITRGGQNFTSDASSKYQGHGRWGAFKETSRLVLGIPDSGGTYYCEVAKYATNGTRTALMTVDQSGNVAATAFNPTSDRNAKQEFAPVDTKEILERLALVPVQTWSFKADPGTRHIGPMAQDFFAAFNVGADERHIATVDADGVALAAIQELYRRVQEQQAELQEKNRQIEELTKRIERLETR